MKTASSTELLRSAALKVLASAGWTHIKKIYMRGRRNVYEATLDGKTVVFPIRTSTDRWFGYDAPYATDGVVGDFDPFAFVVIATVDNTDRPSHALVLVVPADDIKRRCEANYAARRDAETLQLNYPSMWLPLENLGTAKPNFIGGGLIQYSLAQVPLDAAAVRASETVEAAAELDDGHIGDDQTTAAAIRAKIERLRFDYAKALGVRADQVLVEIKVTL